MLKITLIAQLHHDLHATSSSRAIPRNKITVIVTTLWKQVSHKKLSQHGFRIAHIGCIYLSVVSAIYWLFIYRISLLSLCIGHFRHPFTYWLFAYWKAKNLIHIGQYSVPLAHLNGITIAPI